MDYLIADSKILTSQERKELERVWYNDPPYFSYFYSKGLNAFVEQNKEFEYSYKFCYARETKSENLKIVGFLSYFYVEGRSYIRLVDEKDWGHYNDGRKAPVIDDVYVVPSYRHNRFIAERMIMELEKTSIDLFIRAFDNDKISQAAIYNLDYRFQEKYQNFPSPNGAIVERWRKNCGDTICYERNYPVMKNAICLWYFDGDCVNPLGQCNFLLGRFKRNIDNACERAIDSRFEDIYSKKNHDKEVHCQICGFGSGTYLSICPICHSKDTWADKEGHIVSYGENEEEDRLRLRRRLHRENN